MNGQLKKSKMLQAALILILALASVLVSCEFEQSDLIVRFPDSALGGRCSFVMKGPGNLDMPVNDRIMDFVLPSGVYSWELRNGDWVKGPVLSGRLELDGKRRELIIPEPTLTRVTLEIESNTAFESTVTVKTGERGLSEERRVHIIEGITNELVYEDVPEGLFTVTMTDETGMPMAPLSYEVEMKRENIFALWYRSPDDPREREDIELRISSPKSMDTEVLWREKGEETFSTVPVRVLRDMTTYLTLEHIPVGKMELAVRNWDGTIGNITEVTVVEGIENTFWLSAGLENTDDTKVCVRLVSDEEMPVALCFMAKGMPGPEKRLISLNLGEMVYLWDWKEEGLLSIWLELEDGTVEGMTDLYVSKGHVNTITVSHFRPIPEHNGTGGGGSNGDDSIPGPEDPKPLPKPRPEPKWGKLNLHIKANSTEPCILYFLYPGDTEWRTHDTKFNGIGIGRDYEFNNIPPGKFRYTFGLPGEKPFPVNTVSIKKGENSAFYVYYMDPPEVPDLPEPPVGPPDIPVTPDEGGKDPLPPPVPGPDEEMEPEPKPEETEKPLLTGRIDIEEINGGDILILRFINTSDVGNIAATWYVDGKRWSTGTSMRIRSGLGTAAEVMVTSPDAREQLVLSATLPNGRFVPFKTNR